MSILLFYYHEFEWNYYEQNVDESKSNNNKNAYNYMII